MKLPRRIRIDLLDAFRTGCFDCIEPGQDKWWILSNFPDPDGMTEHEAMRSDYSIWRYGNIEFHFDRDTLFLIYSDYLDTLNGGPSLLLDPWIIGSMPLTLQNVGMVLNREGIDYAKRSQPQFDSLTLTLDPSGVQFHFNASEEEYPDPNLFPMSAFAITKRK